MNKKEIENITFEYHNSGFHCAEAILKTYAELYYKKNDLDITKFASGFGVGMGGSKCETCGALTGGIIVIGMFFGRKYPIDDKQKIYSLTQDFRDRFLDSFRSTNCKILLDLFREQGNNMNCKKVTAEAAGILFEILQKGNVNESNNKNRR
jgi:C_GCAxxG_C_C family probable redox protein